MRMLDGPIALLPCVSLNYYAPCEECDESNCTIKPVVEKGREIRRGAPYFEEGSNVNFVEKVNDNTFAIRTYERGVEDETLSCGTGATAVALAMHKTGVTIAQSLNVLVEGGQLTVSFHAGDNAYTNIDLQGPATFVFEGEIA